MAPVPADSIAFGGMVLTVPSSVYPPKEDSELLAGVVEKFARGSFLDFGCASGVLGLTALRVPAVSQVLFADVNPAALKAAKANYEANGFSLSSAKPVAFVKTDFFSNLKNSRFDTISFNPPYLPTEKSERVKGPFNKALDGGIDGRNVTDPFLRRFSRHLNPRGQLLILDSSLADYSKTVAFLKQHGFGVSIEARQKFFFEEIVAIRAVKK